MDFPYQLGVHDQQTQKEKDHIREFTTGKYTPISEHTYTNHKGETRKVIRVFLPKGCILPRTSPLGQSDFLHRGKEGTFYNTPLASEDGFLGRVIYAQDGKGQECDSQKWLEWCGEDATIQHTPHPEIPPVFNKQAMMKFAGQAASEKPSEFNQEAKWEKPQQIKKSAKKS